MAGKSGKFTVFLLVITALAVAGCSSPVGTIGHSVPRAGVYDGLLVKYKRYTYNVGQVFVPATDLEVYLINRDGTQKSLTTADYDVYVIEDVSTGVLTPVPVAGYTFTTPTPATPGKEKAIQVQHKDHKDYKVQYRIVVQPSGSEVSQVSGMVKVEWD